MEHSVGSKVTLMLTVCHSFVCLIEDQSTSLSRVDALEHEVRQRKCWRWKHIVQLNNTLLEHPQAAQPKTLLLQYGFMQ